MSTFILIPIVNIPLSLWNANRERYITFYRGDSIWSSAFRLPCIREYGGELYDVKRN